MAHRMVLHTLFSTTRYGSVGGFDILLMLLGALMATLICHVGME